MTYNQLKYVVSVAQNGSFSRAAKELYIAQPSLSNQIKALEEELGLPLFIRMHHNLKLTEAGHDFVLHARRIINEMDNLQYLMQSYSSYSRGNLIIGSCSDAAYQGILESVASFQNLYPKINISMIMDCGNKLLDLLMTQEIDVAIVSVNEAILNTNDFQYVQLSEDPLVVVTPINHPLADRTALHLKDLKNEKVILPLKGSHIRSTIDTLYSEEEPLTLGGECRSTESCIQMVSCGFGVSVTTASMAKRLNGSFKIIPLIAPVRSRLYLIMLKTTYPGSISDEFFNFLQTQFR